MAFASATLGGLLIVKGAAGTGMAVNMPGLISGLGSAASFAFHAIFGKYGLARYSPWTLLLWGMGIGSAAWVIYRPPWVTFFSYGSEDWIFFLYIAVFATILPFGFFYKGLNCLTPLTTGITSTLEPVTAAVLSFFILGEYLTVTQMTGCALVISAVILLQSTRGQPDCSG
jgi:drug/metabolite transporter (DMT)-like permease